MGPSCIGYDSFNIFNLISGVFDLSQQDDLLGKQGSSSTWPCSKCLVTKEHLQNHGGKEHSLLNCKKETTPKDYSFFKDSLQEVTRHTNIKQQCAAVCAVDKDDESEVLVQTLEDRRKEAKNYGNVISIILMQFESLDDMVECGSFIAYFDGLNK